MSARANLLALSIDGAIQSDPDAPVIRASDRAFLLGDLVFETAAVCKGRVRYWELHLERLVAALAAMRMHGARLPEPRELEALIADASARHALAAERAVLRVTVSRGEGGRGLLPSGEAPPRTLAAIFAAPTAGGRVALELFQATPFADLRSATAGLKVGDRAGAIAQVLARRDAVGSDAPCEGLVIAGGMALSGLASNLFVVRRGFIFTPPAIAGSGIRAGVARELMLTQLAPMAVVAPVPLVALDDADEIFFTSAVTGLRSAAHWNGRSLATATADRLDERFWRLPG